jgi:hypothetical protein
LEALPRHQSRAAHLRRRHDPLGNLAPHGSHRDPNQARDLVGAQKIRRVGHLPAPGRQTHGRPDAPIGARAQSAHRALQMGERLGQQVIVENVVGAGGMTGAARVAKAAPDCAAGAASQSCTSRSRDRSRAGSRRLRRRRLDGVFPSEGHTFDDCSEARAHDQRCPGHAHCAPTLRGPRTARCSAGRQDARISCQACPG